MLGPIGHTSTAPQTSYFMVREPSNSAWKISQPDPWTQTAPCHLSILPTRQVLPFRQFPLSRLLPLA